MTLPGIVSEKMINPIKSCICKFMLIFGVCISFLCYLCMLYYDNYVGDKLYYSENRNAQFPGE